MSKEKGLWIGRENVVLVEKRTDTKTTYQPHVVNSTIDDPISHQIIKKREGLKALTGKLKAPIAKTSSHGRRRPQREIEDERAQKKRMLNTVKCRLNVLTGKNLRPIRLVERSEKVQGIEIVDFASDEQREWWKFIDRNDELANVARISQVYPQGLDLLQEGFELRKRMKTGNLEEYQKANDDYEIFRIRTANIPEQYDKYFVPLFKKITKHFAG